jgi:hypothetical protein
VLTPFSSHGLFSAVHSHAAQLLLHVHTALEIFVHGPPPFGSERVIESARIATAAVLLAAAASPRTHVPKPQTRGEMRETSRVGNKIVHS